MMQLEKDVRQMQHTEYLKNLLIPNDDILHDDTVIQFCALSDLAIVANETLLECDGLVATHLHILPDHTHFLLLVIRDSSPRVARCVVN